LKERPSITWAIFSLLRNRFEADWANFKIIVKLARRVPLPLVFLCRSRIVAKVDSIGRVSTERNDSSVSAIPAAVYGSTTQLRHR
jgi:hypothetical protein